METKLSALNLQGNIKGLQRMRIFLQKYDFNLIYKPGKHLIIADSLSRAPLKDKFHDSFDLDAHVCAITKKIAIDDNKLNDLINATKTDDDLTQIIQF
ncbi:hypothetical protein QE152_g26932 [Popillia japonica]|uniref:Uncharacterized protein n=1 Tax=Popillia japonica TaxID=7064 RepID=A0AAW1JVC8_POPJA